MLNPDPDHRGEYTMTSTAICSVDGCGKPHHSKGMCSSHYSRFKRHGDPLAGRSTYQNEARRWLEDHVHHTGEECLIWPFHRDETGYGGVRASTGKREGAHREMCRLAHGEPPKGKNDASHSCGKGREGCVNPRHLRWDSRAGNLADRLIHGTDHRGEKAPWAKLTDGDILEILALKGLLSQKEIAVGFNVDPSHVSRIHAGMNRGGSYQRKIS